MIFAINTSTVQYSLAILTEQGSIVAEMLMSPGSKNFKGFMPSVHSLFESSGTDLKKLEAVIVVNGPGSFTGLRVGLSTAKGLAQGLGIPLIGVPALEIMASQLPYTKLDICSIVDSRKGEVFYGLFKWNKNQLTGLKEISSVKTKDLPSVVNKEAIFIGNNYMGQGEIIRELFGDKTILAPSYLWNIKASAVGNFGLNRFHEKDFDDSMDLVPFYMRSPDIRPSPFPMAQGND